MIAILDYGMGNVGSIRNMFAKIGAPCVVTAHKAGIESADKIILPGVGAFDHAMTNLRDLGVIPVLEERVFQRRVPILGICLGMQLLSLKSEEGTMPGLGWIDADTVRFRFDDALPRFRIPHMAWNTVDVIKSSPILDDRYEETRFYFVHSYHVRCRDGSDVLARTTYGRTFHSAVMRGNILGVQFHPEKSHKFGLRLLKNFAGYSP